MDRPSANQLNAPPVLAIAEPIPARQRAWWLWALGAMLVVIVLRNFTLPGVPCGFKTITGTACPLCGGTRVATSLANLDLISALVFNPLATSALLIIAVWIALGSFAPHQLQRIQESVAQRLSIRTGRIWFGVIVLLNWAYLVWVGR